METKWKKLEEELSEVKKEKVLLEHQLEMERMKVESEKKKLVLAHDQLREKVCVTSEDRYASSGGHQIDAVHF